MQRTVQPEILDGLPACNLDAMASRRDLVKINYLMGNYRWMRRQIRRTRLSQQDRLLEIGAGDGLLAKKLMRTLGRAGSTHSFDSPVPGAPRHSQTEPEARYPGGYHALDQCGPPRDWPNQANWHSANLLQFSGYGDYTHLLANLILHHFRASELLRLGQRLEEGGIRCIIACEPCRRPVHKLQLRAGKWIGFNYVTLNDGCVSVDAGFRAEELPELLGLDPVDWWWSIDETWMGAYRMRAEKR